MRLHLRILFFLAAFFSVHLAADLPLVNAEKSPSHVWPPQVGEPYPDLELLDSHGKAHKLSEFRGHVVLLEPVGMSCAACQAFSGGGLRGGFSGVTPQKGLPALEFLLKDYANGSSIDDKNLIFVQILFYDMSLGVPTVDQARDWAKHFGFEGKKNHYVLVGTKELQNEFTYKMIPGFHLIDRNFILRSDSSGHNPRDNLYKVLLPRLADLLRRK